MFFLYSFILLFHVNFVYFFEFDFVLGVFRCSGQSVLLEEFAENLEPIAVEDVHAAKEIAEKWLYDPPQFAWFVEAHFHGPDLVNKSGQKVASGVEPDDHGSDEYDSSGGVIVSLCQSFGEVAEYVSNIMQESNNGASFPKIEHVATAKQVKCHNMVEGHL